MTDTSIHQRHTLGALVACATRRHWSTALLMAACVSLGCTGEIGENENPGDTGGKLPDGTAVPHSALRRITAPEYIVILGELLQAHGLPVIETLPTDERTPFDNDYAQQEASPALVDATDYLAGVAADALLADAERRDAIVGCTPTGPSDKKCMTDFVKRFGSRALRRAITDDEVALFVDGTAGIPGALAAAEEADDFYAGVHAVVWAMLQDPEFLYRVELGTPVEGAPDIVKLTPYEVASRLSFFIWGTMPDETLLDKATLKGLESGEGRRDVALAMLRDDRAKARTARFHAMWMGYEYNTQSGELGRDMTVETDALVERVIFTENRPWADLLTFPETFVTPFMAEHYGMPAPSDPKGSWVAYGDTAGGRGGILSHASFLSIGAKFDDSDPVLRGLAVRERLLCTPLKVPADVDIDNSLKGDENAFCKKPKFEKNTSKGAGCVACHQQMNPIGYGLEMFDQTGAFRTHEKDLLDTPEDEGSCTIPGDGDVDGQAFQGPKQLGEVLIASGEVQACLSEQLYRFVAGRSALDTIDIELVTRIQGAMKSKGGQFTFQELVLEMVGQEAFGYRNMKEGN